MSEDCDAIASRVVEPRIPPELNPVLGLARTADIRVAVRALGDGRAAGDAHETFQRHACFLLVRAIILSMT